MTNIIIFLYGWTCPLAATKYQSTLKGNFLLKKQTNKQQKLRKQFPSDDIDKRQERKTTTTKNSTKGTKRTKGRISMEHKERHPAETAFL